MGFDVVSTTSCRGTRRSGIAGDTVDRAADLVNAVAAKHRANHVTSAIPMTILSTGPWRTA